MDKIECDLFETKEFKQDLEAFNKDFQQSDKNTPEFEYDHENKVIFANAKPLSYFGNCIGNRYTAKWKLKDGTIKSDQHFKFYDITSMWDHYDSNCSTVMGTNGGPSDYGFCTVLAEHTVDKKPGFDSNLFWTVMIFWKYCGTTFIKPWDQQMKRLTSQIM